MPSRAIDASAVFVELRDGPGAAGARRWPSDAAISSVNLHEIVAKATEKGATPDQAPSRSAAHARAFSQTTSRPACHARRRSRKARG